MMKRLPWKSLSALAIAAFGLYAGPLLADIKNPEKDRQAQKERALEELLRKATDAGGALKLEFDAEDAELLLEGGEEELAKRLMEMLQDRRRGGVGAKNGDGAGDGLGSLMRFFNAQRDNRRPGRNEKDHRSALSEYEAVVKTASQSTAIVLDEKGKQLSLATVVSADGYLVTKASEIQGGEVTCEFSDGRKLAAKRLDTHERWDLALLKVSADDLQPVRFRPGGADGVTMSLGTFLAASGTGSYPVAIGVVSVAPRNLSSENRGFLGIGMGNDRQGISVTEVRRNSAAQKAGLKVGDVIIEVEGQAVRSPAEMAQLISGRQPKEKVKFRYLRGDKESTATATLGQRPRSPRVQDRSQQLSGPLSENRSEFPNALQHDLTLRPNECGGPLVDLDGDVVGVNVARSGRVQSFAIPAADLQALLKNLAVGKFTLTDPADLQRAVEAARLEEAAINKRLEEARHRLKAAEEALEARQ